MKISKKITLPLELTEEEVGAVKKVQEMLSELLDILDTYDCDTIGCKDADYRIQRDEIETTYQWLDTFHCDNLETYNE